MENIKKRIEEIKKELEGFAQAINQHTDTLSNLKAQFLKKQGAFLELQNIIKSGEEN